MFGLVGLQPPIIMSCCKWGMTVMDEWGLIVPYGNV